MTFRAKLLTFFTLTIIAAVSTVAWGVSVYSRRAFERFDRQRTDALVAQFRREYAQRGDEIVHRMQGIADAEATLRMAMDLNRPQADASQYYNDAHGIAQAQQLDFLDIVSDDGTLISSSEWPARFGYKNDWVNSEADWNSKGAFLRRVDMPDAVELGLLAVRTVRVGEKRLFLIGGQRLDQNFLSSLVLPESMRTLLYRNLERGFIASALTDVHGPVAQADSFSPIVTEVQATKHEVQRTIDSGSERDRSFNSETFNAIPLLGREGDLLGVLLVGSSRLELVQMLNFIRELSFLVGGGVIFLGLIIGWWISARVTHPIEELAFGARQVAAGQWGTHVEIHSRDEIGQLAAAFNDMTRQLAEQRERLVQTERVAAWRELARRLAHELKNPLFPLQLTVENLQRARRQSSDQFDEIFLESTTTLRAELENLKAVVSRFSDFAKMPQPEFESVDLNESVRNVIKLFEPQLSAVGRPPIAPELYLDEHLPHLQADPVLLRRALENLLLNSIDAMPAGGALSVRTSKNNGSAVLEVTDTGAGLTPEECARVFTPYYTSKRQGTGLGLAIVQSVVSDHGGTIVVESAPGVGATFRIELPIQHSSAQNSEPEFVSKTEPSTGPSVGREHKDQTVLADVQAVEPLDLSDLPKLPDLPELTGDLQPEAQINVQLNEPAEPQTDAHPAPEPSREMPHIETVYETMRDEDVLILEEDELETTSEANDSVSMDDEDSELKFLVESEKEKSDIEREPNDDQRGDERDDNKSVRGDDHGKNDKHVDQDSGNVDERRNENGDGGHEVRPDTNPSDVRRPEPPIFSFK